MMRIVPAVNLDLSGLPVHDPILQDAAGRVQFQFGLAIPTLIGKPWRNHFDYKVRRAVELPVGSEQGFEPVCADPDDVRSHILIIGEYETGCHAGFTLASSTAPGAQDLNRVSADSLMIVVGLFGHKEFSVDDLIAVPIIGESAEVGRSPTSRCSHNTINYITDSHF
jgi:hypothetical protein